ncbi:hypothetical protein JX265_000303 [Neoarthrinium moseri]|uniref:Apple domain-containing protein n=1 Tax=Neoarthrinium moseri TaxID=1658444 RepID=A0A9Q0AW46_9PEZI|nr:uncharacterized protein JN550_000553 [Neoarthrinium moseri]KAI1878371.1 hypothetical protein JN550_000553 [Neoarthrinium moseri]KAI1881477.1 hypothetical protein JX265_000303 [Neoarthrinium moseri]
MAYQQHYQQPQYPQEQYPQGPAAGYAANWNANNNWDSSAPEVVPQWHQPPTGHAAEGIARANHWVAAQQQSSMSPPPTAKTPFSDYGSATTGSYPLHPGTVVPPPPKPRDRICGVKKNVFFIVLAIAAFVFVVGIATGLGVGLGSGKNSSNAAASGQSTSSSSTSTTSTPTTSSETPTKVSPTPSFTGTVTKGSVLCPRDNGTVYISSITSKPFNVECGHDYNSQDGAKDLSHQPAATMAECIDACGENDSCVGVGWGNYQGTYTCWLKKQLGTPNDSSKWYFAKLQDLDASSGPESRRWVDG